MVVVFFSALVVFFGSFRLKLKIKRLNVRTRPSKFFVKFFKNLDEGRKKLDK